MRVQLLGPAVLGQVPLGSGRRAGVLAVLALHAGVTKEQIIAAVWGDDPPASASGNVYTHINALRDIVGEESLTRSAGAYRLHVAAVDALRFEQLRELAALHRAAGDNDAELATLAESLRLWQGEALAGIPGPFAEARRARLHELRLAAQQRHAEVLLTLGRPAEAVAALRPLAAEHPLQESLHELLMIALHADGQRSVALAVYDGFHDFLVRETGTEPAASLRRTRERIAGHRTRDIVRAVAFLGDGATVGEVSQVTGLPPATVAREAGDDLLLTSGTLAFRDQATARELRGNTPEALRATLHAFFAEMIAEAYGPPERVAAQLLLSGPAPLSNKASRWLLENIDELAAGSPADAVALVQRAHLHQSSDQETHLALSVWLARLLFRQGQDAVPEAGWVAARTGDPDVQAEMWWIAAVSHDRQGRPAAAAEVARSMLGARRHAQPWLDRFRGLVLRLRLSLPGEPTAPRHDRGDVVSAKKVAKYRRTIGSA